MLAPLDWVKVVVFIYPKPDIAMPVKGLRCCDAGGVGCRRIVPERPVEHIAELHPNVQCIAFFDSPGAPEVHVFGRAALGPVVVVVRGRSSELPRGRIDPRGWIQSERRARVVAVAVQARYGVERLAWNAIGKRPRSGSGAAGNRIEQQRCSDCCWRKATGWASRWRTAGTFRRSSRESARMLHRRRFRCRLNAIFGVT